MSPLVPATKYYVRGRLACTHDNSDFIYNSFTTPCPNVSLLSVNAITPFSANITWVDNSNTGSYVLTYAITSVGIVSTIQTNSTLYRLDGLSPGTEYSVAVAPQCTLTKDFMSTTFNTICYQPFNLSVDALTQTTAELSWDDQFDALPYSVDYSISGSNVWQTTDAPLRNILLADLRPGTEYDARVHINCTSQTAPYIAVHFTTDLYDETTFAPNPTDHEITIYPSRNLIGNRFVILDNTGRLMADGKLVNYTINVSDFPSGIYTLKIDGSRPVRISKN
jgi:hypothetical protein